MHSVKQDSEYFFVFIKILIEKLRNMWSYILDVQEAGKTSGVVVGDFLPANKHEPVDSSHGARFMAKEVGVVFLMFLSTMNLAPHLQSKAALSYNDWHNME